MQQLTDIEGDLADTAIAVAASAPNASTSGSMAQDNATEAASSQQEKVTTNPVIQNAEAMVSVLEQSIPDAPALVSATATESTAEGVEAGKEEVEAVQPESTTMQIDQIPAVDQPQPEAPVSSSSTLDPALQNHATDIPAPTDQHSAAAEANDAIQAVDADISEPILPENGTELEPSSSQAADVTATETNGAPIEVHGLNDVAPAEADTSQVKLEHPGPISTLPPKPTPAVPETGDVRVKEEDLKPEVNFPEGLTASSPSVVSNPGIIHDWQHGEHLASKFQAP